MRSIPQLHTLPHLLLAFLLPSSFTTTTTYALPTELIPVPKGGLWSWSWINGSFLGIPYIYIAAGAGGLVLLFIIMAVFFYFRKRREDRRYARLVEESGEEGALTVTSRGGFEPRTSTAATVHSGGHGHGNGHGGQHVVTYLYDERPLSQQQSSQQHTAAFVGGSGGGQVQPQMSEIRHSTVYYSEKAPIQIQTHDPVTGYPFPQGQVQFFELSTNATTITANNALTSSPATERSEIDFKEGEDSKKEEEKTPVSLDQLPERLYSHPPPELHHKLSSLSVASTATLPVSTPAHVHPEGSGSEEDLKKSKVVAVATVVAQVKKNVSSSPPAGSPKDAKVKPKVQLRRDVSVSKNIKKAKNMTTGAAKPKSFT
ncbi:hypothetical protein BG015_007102 [Linnemannia schmuckeri]|uniref:Uncharacterized protein n=1 Tax=Linnemannia schmuckeri TaxID=64567 RepID=A0A9P5S186_9FUNG|nr:hypothetical protein BG015_007102 [Linnemannia schmuckeri]